MKKLLIFAAVATMLAACSKDATQDLAVAKPIDKFYATIADNNSRVQLNDACQTVWTAGDRVAVFNKTSDKCRYKFTGQTGDVKGELSYISGRGNGYEIDKVIAVYPYNSAYDIYEDGRLSIFAGDATQEYRKDSFYGNSNVMVARSETENLSFQNVMGWIRIALTGDKIVKTITLKGYNNEKLAGKVTIAEDLSIIDFAKDVYSNTIELDCGSGIRLTDTPTYFYITVVPQTFEQGFCVEITDANKNIVLISTNKAVTIERNHIVNMAKSICDSEHISNQIRYTTSDGGIITPNSYNGTIISNTYTNGKGVITFDCAQTSISTGAFKDCSTMTSITIPNSVTQIGNSAFQGCVGLTNITIPDNVTSINASAFYGCTSLYAIYGKHVSADHRCYIVDGELKCFIPTGLTTYTIPDGITSIGDSAFSGCTSLTSVAIPDSVTSIGSYAFWGCTGLTNLTIPDSVTSIGDYAFSSCKHMKVEKFKVLLYLKKSGLDKNGKAPIMGRITLNRTMAQFGCKLSCTPKLWNPRESRLDGKSKEAVEVNAKIDKLLLAVNSAYESLVERKVDFDAKAIKDLFQCSADTQVTLLKELDAINRDIESRIGIDYKKGTLPNYHYTRLTLGLFVKKRYGTDDVAFGELDEQFIREYMDFCMDERGLALDTVRHYLAILKKTCRIAFKAGHSERYHFMHFKLPQKKENPPKALTREDFLKIRDFEIPERRKSLALTRDLFLFACYTGTAYADTVSITEENLFRDEEGSLWLKYHRKKNEMLARVKLPPEAIAMLEKYKDPARKTLLPWQEYCILRANMKSLRVLTGISMDLVYHVGRHSFASLVTLEEGVPIETISKMLGHNNIQTTQIYARVTPKKLFEDMDKFIEANKDFKFVL